jgi:hypothetical protein
VDVVIKNRAGAVPPKIKLAAFKIKMFKDK